MRWPLPSVSRIYLQFLLALSLIAVIPLGLVGLGIATLDRRTLAEQSARELTSIASAIAGELNIQLTGLLRDTDIIAALPSVVSMNPVRQNQVLQELFLHNDQFNTLDILDTTGQLLASSHLNRRPVIDPNTFQAATGRGQQTWSITTDPNSDQRLLLIYTPIRSPERQVIGVLAGTVNLRDLAAVVRKVQVGSGQAFVLDQAGHVLLHPDSETMAWAESGPWQAAFQNKELVGTGTTTYLKADELYDAGFASLVEFNWTVLVERPKAEVVAPAQRAFYLTLAAVVLSAGLAFVTALWLAGRLTRPIRLLAEAARAFAQGDSSLPLPQKFNRENELGVLVNAFADMRETVTRREAALRQSESQNRAILNAIPDIILQVNADGRLLACKAANEDSFPLFSTEAVGKTLPQICPESFAQKALHMVRQTLQQPDQSHRLECQLATAGDEANDYEARFAVSGSDEVLIMVRNITAQRRAEEQLRLMRSVVLNTSESVLITEARPIDKPGPRIVYVNEAFTHMTGYSVEEIIGLNPRILQGPRTDRAQLDRIRTALTHCQPVRVELINYRRDGSEFWVDFSIAPLNDDNGQVTHFVSVQRDVTDRKQAEAELQRTKDALVAERASLARRVEARTAELRAANAELARAARLKDEFLAAMSHELRTPLNAILGMSEALQEQAFGPLNADQLDSLHEVTASGRHLLELINDILDLSKIEEGKMELTMEPVWIKNVCQASLRIVKQSAHQKQIKIMSTIDQTATAIPADERRLKQILVNLLSNAVKFTPAGGQVGLEVIADVSRESIDFTVWDTGIGIAQEDMAQLFQPFVQLDSRLSRRYDGTGLGLALVYRLTELHGGSITVNSEPGRGSRFIISLPWADAAAEPAETAVEAHQVIELAPILEPSPLGESNATAALILLAEDNEANIRTVSRYLQRKGYQLIVARNGVEAIERTKQERPALILMDIQMPELDGLQAIGRLRADREFAHTPIIALTALAMPGDQERCLAAGANVYLSKPVSLGQLAREIEAQLNLQTAQKNIS